jgi:hypothetical protein
MRIMQPRIVGETICDQKQKTALQHPTHDLVPCIVLTFREPQISLKGAHFESLEDIRRNVEPNDCTERI